MPMTVEQIAYEMLGLPQKSRAELAHRLLRSLDNEDSPEIEAQHLEIIRRRVAEIKDGKVECIPVEETMRRAREALQ